MPLQFGGPYLGYISCSKTMLRKMPGRVVGATKDIDGKRGYVLTLQARESSTYAAKRPLQHMLQPEALWRLYATIYLALMGKRGNERGQQAQLRRGALPLQQAHCNR